MSSQFGFIDIILLAMFAGFIILRLRHILGRKTGFQGKTKSRYFPKGVEVLKDIENNEAIKNGNVDEVNELLCAEMRVHVNEARVICCLKVSDFRKEKDLAYTRS